MTITAHDPRPVLHKGWHERPLFGGCLMEYVSVLAGEPWSDDPPCTHPLLAATARSVNDLLEHDERQRLLSLAPRLLGTATRADAEHDRMVTDALVRWLDNHTPITIPSARHPRLPATLTPLQIYFTVGYAADHGQDLTALLTGLLDEYDRVTKRETVPPLTAQDLRRLHSLAA